MIIYVVQAHSGSFEAFSNKKDAEKCKKELSYEASNDGFAPVDATVCKYTIKTKKELINVINQQSGGWEQLQMSFNADDQPCDFSS